MFFLSCILYYTVLFIYLIIIYLMVVKMVGRAGFEPATKGL